LTDPNPGKRPSESTDGAAAEQDPINTPASQDLEAGQTLSDGDQSAADVDQGAADSDQVAADRDQAASDRDLADGGDPAVHDASRDIRDRSAHQRRHANRKRGETGAARDSVAHARDLAADARDRAAAALDRDLAERDTASDRSAAAEARNRAAKDREGAAADRKQAAGDRLRAQEERDALLHELAISEMDALTGARARAPGLADLDNEIDRARRTTGQLAVAYIDIVGLKAVNDKQGHSAGDQLLKNAVQVIRGHLRSYDAIVRIGGDEFLCVMSGAALQSARRRFDSIQAALAAGSGKCEIKVGIAALGPEDSAAELIERADAALAPRRTKNGAQKPSPKR
jgi:diguanylate cyclase (GGDEF)-like protein